MVISNYSLQVIELQYQDRFNLSLQEKLQNLFPGFYKDNAGLRKIENKRRDCEDMDILTEQGIFLFLCVEPLFGPEFYQRIDWRELFLHSDGNGDYLIKSLFESLKSN